MHLSKPKPSDRERVVNGLIRCAGVAVQVRTLSKNIRHVGTEAIKCKQTLQSKKYLKFQIAEYFLIPLILL